MTVNTLSTLPAWPPRNTQDPDEFIGNTDAMLAALVAFVPEFNANVPDINTAATSAAAALTASEGLVNGAAADAGFIATSTSSVALTVGSKSATIETGKSFAADDAIFLMRRSNAAIRAYAEVTNYSGSTLSFDIANTDDIIGSGTYDDWIIGLEAFEPFQTPISYKPVFPLIVEVTPEAYAAAAGTGKRTFHAGRDYVLNEVIAELSTVQASGSIFTVDINVNGTTILSTKLTVDNSEETSITAATPYVFAGGLGYVEIAKGDKITIDIDQIGNGTAKGLKVHFIWQEQE